MCPATPLVRPRPALTSGGVSGLPGCGRSSSFDPIGAATAAPGTPQPPASRWLRSLVRALSGADSWEPWIAEPRVWFHPWGCSAESLLGLLRLFSLSPDATRGGGRCQADPEGAPGGVSWREEDATPPALPVPPWPPCLCTLLFWAPELQSRGSYFCSLRALEAAGLSKVILQ